MQQIMITGSNRGIGLALTKEHLSRGDVHIFATCRNPDTADALHTLQEQYPNAVTIVAMDVNDTASIDRARDEVASKTDHLDLLFNNAGIYPKTPEHVTFGQLERDALTHVVATNSISPVIVTQAFAALLKGGTNPRVVMVSSQMGSITRAGGNAVSYRMSKASMNMAAKILSQILLSDGITVITTHPGWVQTDMGGTAAAITAATSAKGLTTVAANITTKDAGKFYNYDGSEMPW